MSDEVLSREEIDALLARVEDAGEAVGSEESVLLAELAGLFREVGARAWGVDFEEPRALAEPLTSRLQDPPGLLGGLLAYHGAAEGQVLLLVERDAVPGAGKKTTAEAAFADWLPLLQEVLSELLATEASVEAAGWFEGEKLAGEGSPVADRLGFSLPLAGAPGEVRVGFRPAELAALVEALRSSQAEAESREGEPTPAAPFQPLGPEKTRERQRNIDLILDVPLAVTVELGRTERPVRDILSMGPGVILELDRMAGESVDVLVNGRLIAKGEVVVIDENFGIRITDILSAQERIQRLR